MRVRGQRGGHGAGGLAHGDDMERAGKKRGDVGIGERARDRTVGAHTINRGADDGQQVGSESAGGPRQLTLFGSDQVDSRVTRSNSRSSLETTWSASTLVERVSTWEMTLTSADCTLSIA